MDAPKTKQKVTYLNKDGIKQKEKTIRIKPIRWYENKKGCFVCISHRMEKGYARLVRQGKDVFCHRYIYEELFGEIPEGLVVRHKCDNPACINPEHLELGTIIDNNNDKLLRNRQTKGEDIKISKLTEKQVLKIREEYKEIKSSRILAKKYNVDKATILDIIKRKTWKHI